MKLAWHEWRAGFRPGDALVVGGGLLVCVVSALTFWQGGVARWAEVRAGGTVVARLSLDQPAKLNVDGPLGRTEVHIEPGRARVYSDPGPRQYCVLQGWLTRAGAVAICAPNEVSLRLLGDTNTYDTLNY
ncbi:NusG domain II-containing protein [Denitromonas sp.]|uniref:NusG domain II-containing protein n=1 Tax=Denitromonas sp. TaxID=2734609 RepID=UPI00353A33FD